MRALHRWDLAPREAAALQRRLAGEVVLAWPRGRRVRLVAGLDAAFAGGDAVAAAVVVRLPALAVVETAVARVPLRFPYVPGLLSFREAPALLAALDALQARPDLLLVDGQGIAHPRRFGLACHVGLWTGIPAVGVAKSLLVGTHAPLARVAGARAPILHRGERVGAAVRLREPVLFAGARGRGEELVVQTEVAMTDARLDRATRCPASDIAAGPRSGAEDILRRVGEATRRRDCRESAAGPRALVNRSGEGGRPVLVSPGHLCDAARAVRLVLRCAAGHRLPEPTFLADRAAGAEARALRTREAAPR